MAKNKVETSKEDFLSEMVAEAPEKQTRNAGPRADFVPDADILAKVATSLATTGAITSAKGYGSEKEARSAGRLWRVYAEHAAEGIEGKTISPKMLNRGTTEAPSWHWKFQLATKRVRKDAEEATPTEAPATEAPAK